jgi:hypothetical protein
MPLLSLPILIVTGCYRVVDGPRDPGSLPTPGVSLHVELVPSAAHIEDKNRMNPADNASLLWNKRGHSPILAPDGHQVTLGEFKMVAGGADVTCINQGTTIDISLQGLITNGVYSLWIYTFKLPGYHNNFDHLAGNGVLKLINGTENIFTASSNGSASLSAIMHAQSLSILGSVGDCLFAEYEIHIMAAYHLNNVTHDGTPGNPNTWVTQFFFPFLGK